GCSVAGRVHGLLTGGQPLAMSSLGALLVETLRAGCGHRLGWAAAGYGLAAFAVTIQAVTASCRRPELVCRAVAREAAGERPPA
ncbi:MAG TPA: hypothetical protein VKG45_05410, partial [Actinomycetes bacterium]|nr:hypothetical protein [Actinomycetes bacterium]